MNILVKIRGQLQIQRMNQLHIMELAHMEVINRNKKT